MLAVLLMPVMAASAAPGSHDFVAIFQTETFAIEGSSTATMVAERCCHGRSAATVEASTVGGTAAADQDYAPTTATISFREPIDSGEVAIPLTDDSEIEPLETIEVQLSDPTGGMALSAARTGTITVIDNDGPSRVSFAKASVSGYEHFGAITLRVVRAGDASQAVTVPYSTQDGSATSGSDYVAATGTVEISAGSRLSKPLSFEPVNDSSREGSESFSVTLGSPTGAESADPSVLEVTILDDETPSSDTTPPVTAFHQPLHGSTYSARNVRDILVFTEDAGSGVRKVHVALRAKMTNGSCRWFSRKARGFVRGPCDQKLWSIRLSGAETVVYALPEKLRASRGTNIASYMAWSRGVDELGNVERSFEKSRNVSRFEVR